MAPHAIVILTGAGISAESGLATFRDPDGIWARHRIEDVATPEAWRRDPAKVTGFYNARRRQLLDPAVAPNPAHHALVRLEQAWPGDFLLVTQNVDNLHDRAGSHRLIHMHGELARVRCTSCGAEAPWLADVEPASACPACGATGSLRPAVVWFGEMPLEMERIARALTECDVFIAIGTSGAVYPAAGFVGEARAAGAHTMEVNLEPSDVRSRFHEARHGPAATLVPALVEELLAAR
ncbi:MAG: NAD-dependent protein deacylase [Alphaproteobacteria bacterium]|nr:MAG: NAD-dependent protein deacylase [Alphaproteobacteria bacterium]